MKISEFVQLISVLELNTYENKKYLFFYDALTELSKYYMIYKAIDEELDDGNQFKKKDDMVEEKTKLFEAMNNE